MARAPSKRDAAVATEPMGDDDADGGNGEAGMDVLTAMLIGCFVFVVFGIGVCFYQMKDQYDAGKDPALFYKGQDLNHARVRKDKLLGRASGGEAAPADAPAEKPADAPAEAPAEESKPAEE